MFKAKKIDYINSYPSISSMIQKKVSKHYSNQVNEILSIINSEVLGKWEFIFSSEWKELRQGCRSLLNQPHKSGAILLKSKDVFEAAVDYLTMKKQDSKFIEYVLLPSVSSAEVEECINNKQYIEDFYRYFQNGIIQDEDHDKRLEQRQTVDDFFEWSKTLDQKTLYANELYLQYFEQVLGVPQWLVVLREKGREERWKEWFTLSPDKQFIAYCTVLGTNAFWFSRIADVRSSILNKIGSYFEYRKPV